MPKRNKTSDINYRFLSNKHFDELYQTNLDAFSDYIVPFQMTSEQFKNHIAQNAVDLSLSVGAFAESKMVGFTLNGFGVWEGKKTAYDAGTGVIPEFRRRGIGESMFRFLFPKLRETGTEQILLEVIEKNKQAIGLYSKLGFEQSRRLLLFEQDELLELKRNEKIKIRELKNPDWKKLRTFGKGTVSWQFSTDSVKRKPPPKLILGAFLDETLVGYGVFFPRSGTVVHIAVAREHRRKRIASTLLFEMRAKCEEDVKLRFTNVDESLSNIIGLIKNFGFKQTISQIEMLKIL